MWRFVEHCVNIDNAKAEGNELDEMEAHRFLEKADEAHTVLEMRSRLRKTGAIGQNERPKAVPLSHYLLFKYDAHNDKLFHELVTRAQGDNQKQIEEAQAKLDAVSVAFEEASRTAAAASAALKEAQSREAAAKVFFSSSFPLSCPFFFFFFFFFSFFYQNSQQKQMQWLLKMLPKLVKQMR